MHNASQRIRIEVSELVRDSERAQEASTPYAFVVMSGLPLKLRNIGTGGLLVGESRNGGRKETRWQTMKIPPWRRSETR